MNNINPLQNDSEAQQAAMFRELLRRNNRDEITILSENSTTLTSLELVDSLRATLDEPAMTIHALAHQQLSRPGPIVLGRPEKPSYFIADDFPSLAELAQSYLEHTPVLAESRIAKMDMRLMACMPPLITVRSLLPQQMPALGELCMMPPAQCYGWVAKMRRLGYRVSTKLEGHGRQRHAIRKGDMTFSVLQGGTTALRYSVGPLSMFDYQVVDDLKKVGVLVDTGQPAKTTPAPAQAEAL